MPRWFKKPQTPIKLAIRDAQREAAVAHRAACRLIAEPDLDPNFPAGALLCQSAAAASARAAMRDLTKLIRRA